MVDWRKPVFPPPGESSSTSNLGDGIGVISIRKAASYEPQRSKATEFFSDEESDTEVESRDNSPGGKSKQLRVSIVMNDFKHSFPPTFVPFPHFILCFCVGSSFHPFCSMVFDIVVMVWQPHRPSAKTTPRHHTTSSLSW